MKFGKVFCPDSERPGCKENAEKNRRDHQEMVKALQGNYDCRDYDRHGPRKGPLDNEKKPRFHKMTGKTKKSFVRAMITNNNVDEF